MTGKLLVLPCIAALGLCYAASAADNSASATRDNGTESMGRTIKIRLKAGDKTLSATLADSAASRDFAAQLPLTLTLEDYVGKEKISDLPKKLSKEGAPPGSDPSVGDIAYYAPWGNLAIFYKDSGYASGLVLLGKVDSGMEALSVPGSITVTVERIAENEHGARK